MAQINLSDYADQAATAVRSYRAGTNPYWADSYLNMGAQLAQQAMENDYNLQLWNMNNEYNTPAAQMARYKAAGLNPNLIYQQGSPGNSNSPATASHASYDLSPRKDTATLLNNVAGVVQMITNLAGNVSQMVGQGYDTALKRNELAWSNTELAAANNLIYDFGSRSGEPKYRYAFAEDVNGDPQHSRFSDKLNPFSANFSPLEYNTLMRLGKIPSYFTGQLTGQAAARLSDFRSDYQKYYNESMLPLLKDYQSGKIDIQDLTKEILGYNKQALESLPPEIRGIMQPIMSVLNLLFRAGGL